MEPSIRVLHDNDEEMRRKEEILELLTKTLKEEISRHYYGAWKKKKIVVSSFLKVSCKMRKKNEVLSYCFVKEMMSL